MVKCQIPKLLGAKCIISIDTSDISKVFHMAQTVNG